MWLPAYDEIKCRGLNDNVPDEMMGKAVHRMGKANWLRDIMTSYNAYKVEVGNCPALW